MKKVFYILSVLLLAFTACGTDGKDNNSDDPWEWNNPDEGKPDEGKPDNDGTVFYPKAEGSVRIMSYNVGAFSKYLSNSTEMVAAMILEAEADVVGLNELDSCNTRHNVNQMKALAAALDGWKWTFGRAMSYKDGAYGNGVVVPRNTDIIDSYTVALPKGTGSEPRSIAVVETPDYILGAAHLDHTSEESVLGQIEVVHAWGQKYKGSSKPVFFCGDMNSRPGSAAINSILTKWEMLSSTENTIRSNAPTSCIDFIFRYRDAASVKVTGTHTMTRFHNGDVTKASDHLPVYADVVF